MEGLAAVGAASSIIQLVDFSLKLVATGKEIRDSLTGSSLQNEALEDVYQQMRSILQPVEDLTAANISQPFEPRHRVILASANTARRDCGEILNLLDKLKLKNNRHKQWGSVIKAFKSMMGQKRIIEIESRLRTELASVSIELTKLTWYEVQKLNDNVAVLIREASSDGIENDPQLGQLSKSCAHLCTEFGNSDPEIALCSTEILMKKAETLVDRGKRYESVKDITTAKQAVINSLHFESRARRHEAIPESHQNTFDWIYSIPSFQKWMQDDGGIFWIHGKPGSGKSALIKFLASNPQSRAFLDKWAQPYKATIASHYFWNVGTEMQKSLLGLMQTLVFEILRQEPDSIQLACPIRWKMAREDQDVFSNQKKYDREGQWTMHELSDTIKRLEQGEDGSIHTRLCLFVDGLDEFEGDHRQVCKLLTSLASLPHVKICLSSRPLNVFRYAFGGNGTRELAIHNLTGNDMERFVNDHLVSHPNWGGGGPHSDCMIDDDDKMSLVNEIRERANGVFLWVSLVTKSICDGLTNQDSIHDLRERLRILPTDLGDLFRHILNRIDPAYSKKSAEFLWIAVHEKNGGLPVDAYYHHERDHEPTNNQAYAVKFPIGPSKVNVQLASRRITALTGGLLEVTSKREIVTFLHRTVAEFLSSGEIKHEITKNMRQKFDTHLALAKISTVLLKCERLEWPDLKVVLNTYLPNVERQNFTSTLDLLSALELTAIQRGYFHDFKAAILLSPLSEHVSLMLSVDESYFLDLPMPPAALLLKESALNDESIEMLRVLGEHGQGLNQPELDSPHTSPWVTFFRNITMNFNFKESHVNDKILSFGKLVAIGADPNAQVGLSRNSQSVFSVYLLLPFSTHAGYLNPDAYLDTLNVFLDHAADFWQPITFTGYVDWWPREIDSSCNTVEKALSKGLNLLGSDPEMMPRRNLVFQAVKRILTKRADDGPLMSRLRIAIPQAFPEHRSYFLLSLIPPAHPRGQPRIEKG